MRVYVNKLTLSDIRKFGEGTTMEKQAVIRTGVTPDLDNDDEQVHEKAANVEGAAAVDRLRDQDSCQRLAANMPKTAMKSE